MIEQALTYLSYGLQVLPLKPGKVPFGKWADLQNQLQTDVELTYSLQRYSATEAVKSIGIIAGRVSGSLEIIDVDCKYDLTGTLYQDLKSLIDDNLPELTSLFVICRTRNGGYHFYYRCSEIAGNQKLARRLPTPTEIEKGERVLDLIETRGEGGYVVAPPTEGYQLIQGDFSQIPVLTPEQRNALWSICRSLDEEPQKDEAPTRYSSVYSNRNLESNSDNPFKEYNLNVNTSDVIGLLEKHGWSFVKQDGKRLQMKRPGDSESKTSGNFHEEKRKFWVFSSSAELDPNIAYSPVDLFIKLECNGDTKEANQRLRSMGYGAPQSAKNGPNQVSTTHTAVKATDAKGEMTNVSTDNLLTEEKIRTTAGKSFYVYYTESTPKSEIFQSLALLKNSSFGKIYLAKVESLEDIGNPISVYRPSEFKAQEIIDQYTKEYEVNNSLGPERQDYFVEEFIKVRQELTDPFEIALFKDHWLFFGERNDLPITEEYINSVEGKIKKQQLQQRQTQAVEKLLEKATDLVQQGKPLEALSVWDKESKQIDKKDNEDKFAELSRSLTRNELAEKVRKKHGDLLTGYTIQGEPLILPAGGLTFICGGTGSGKTAFTTNLAIRITERLPDKKVYLLHYEQDVASATIIAMNIFIGERLSKNNKRSIRGYYRDEPEFIEKDTIAIFKEGEADFFKKLIEPEQLIIRDVDYEITDLCNVIRRLHKEGEAGAILIDYMQLLNKEGKYGDRQKELKDICIELKDAARDTGLPIILGAQFNRTVTNAGLMVPQRIGEAGDIERIAHLILGIWNNNQKTQGDESNGLKHYAASPTDSMYLEVLKDRDGAPGPDRAEMLSFNGNTGVITNYEPRMNTIDNGFMNQLENAGF